MFSANLINDPFEDPGVYIKLLYRGEAILFDIGDIRNLTPRKILKIKSVFVSHTHMDHFIGFDHLLRVCLGREKVIHFFGPPGFINNVESKLGAYTWNLIMNYTNDFIIRASEIHNGRRLTCDFSLQKGFQRELKGDCEVRGSVLLEEEFYRIEGIALDHKIPCLAFSLVEKKRVNIKKTALEEMGLPVGQWLMNLKAGILRDDPDDAQIKIVQKGGAVGKMLPLGLLREKIVKVTAGEKISYVTDIVYNDDNYDRLLHFIGGSDVLFIETTFLEEDSDRAGEKYHLTARQAGELARKAGVKRIVPFHFSPKYQKNGDLLVREAMNAFAPVSPQD